MKLIPRDSLIDFGEIVEQFFNASHPTADVRTGFFSPRVDIRESDDHFEICAEMPGVRKEDLEVAIDNGVLTIDAEMHQEDKEEKNSKIVRQERRYGKFTRSFNLGRNISDEDIDASFTDGVLKLSVKKSEPQKAESHKINIH